MHERQLPHCHQLAHQSILFAQLARFIFSAPPLGLRLNLGLQFRVRFFRVAKCLAQKSHVKIDLHHAGARDQRPDHFVGQVSWRGAQRVARRV